MIINLPKVEAEVAVVEDQQGNFNVESALAQFVRRQWERAKMAKTSSGMDDRLIECERRRRGQYDPTKLQAIREMGGSEIWLMLTDIKCSAAKSWIMDVMMANDRMFDLDVSADPDLPIEIKEAIIDAVKIEAQQFAAQGGNIQPEAFRERMEQVHDEMVQKLREEAEDAARRMGDTIQDSFDKGCFDTALTEFVDDFVTYPTAFMRGPVVRRKKRLTWGPEYQPIVLNDLVLQFQRISPHDVFPSPGSKGVNDGYLCVRHKLDTPKLEALRGTPGYNSDEIDKAIETYGVSGIQEWLTTDAERDRLENKDPRMFRSDEIEAVEYMGPVRGDVLIGWGLKNKQIKPTNTYEVNVWLVGSYCIRAVLNPDPLGRRNFYASSWRKIAGAMWGQSLTEIVADLQDLANGAARALQNNMAIASGPQVEVTADRLAEGEVVTSMYPWKLWQTTSDRTGGGQPGIRFMQPNMHSDELLGVMNSFMRQADEVTGIPNYTYGATGGASGAGRTASGLSMLMDNAAKGIKSSVLSIDNDVVEPSAQALYMHHMQFNPDNFIKGDFAVKTKGALGLIHKETLLMRRNEFLQMTANPFDMQIVGITGRASILREQARSLQMDTDKIVPPEEVIMQKQAQAMQPPAAPPPDPIETAERLADIEMKEASAAANFAKAGEAGIAAMRAMYGFGAQANAGAVPPSPTPPDGGGEPQPQNPGASVAPMPNTNAAPIGAVAQPQ